MTAILLILDVFTLWKCVDKARGMGGTPNRVVGAKTDGRVFKGRVLVYQPSTALPLHQHAPCLALYLHINPQVLFQGISLPVIAIQMCWQPRKSRHMPSL